MSRPRVFILGKLPPPYFGPAIATQIILHSKLNDQYELIHINTAINKQIGSIGNFVWWKPLKGFFVYLLYLVKLSRYRPALILIPNGQTTASFIKDSLFIFFGRLFGGHILLQLRGSNWKNWLNGVNRLTRWYIIKSLKLTSGVIVLGGKLRYLFNEHFPENRIFVVPNGADLSFTKRSENGRHELNVLYFSNLFRSKGVEDVIEAAAHFRKITNLPFRFTLTGTWNDEQLKQKCIEKINSDQLPIKIYTPATGTEKLRFFEEADIFVFPPRAPEGHPWVIVEAMAAGLPIISTDQGAITESVIDGVNGFIVDSNNPSQIAEKVNYLMNHPEIREKMGKESRRLYEENFTEEKMIEKLKNVFNTVLNMP